MKKALKSRDFRAFLYVKKGRGAIKLLSKLCKDEAQSFPEMSLYIDCTKCLIGGTLRVNLIISKPTVTPNKYNNTRISITVAIGEALA